MSAAKPHLGLAREDGWIFGRRGYEVCDGYWEAACVERQMVTPFEESIMDYRERSLRGFATMNKERQREIASRGGRAAHERGTAHEFDSMEASMAARKGHEHGTAHEFTPEEARIAGRKGGLARALNRSRQTEAVASGAAVTEPLGMLFEEPPKQ